MVWGKRGSRGGEDCDGEEVEREAEDKDGEGAGESVAEVVVALELLAMIGSAAERINGVRVVRFVLNVCRRLSSSNRTTIIELCRRHCACGDEDNKAEES